MIEIGEKPILWHIMKMYSAYGFNEFVICCGYKQHVIKEWFADYYLHNSNITFDFTQENKMIVHNNVLEPWKVTLVDTGLNTMTGGRIKRVKEYLDGDTFMLTYGDGVADVNIRELLEYHRSHGKMATITAAQPGGRFGILDIEKDGTITNFREKKKEDGGWINAGFMVLEPEILDLIEGDATVFEKYPLEEAARRGLPNIKSMVEASETLTTEKSIKLFEKFGIFTKAELESREEVLYETYSKTINIEALTMVDMAKKQYIPAVMEYTKTLADTVLAVKSAGVDATVQTTALKSISEKLAEAQAAETSLEDKLAEAAGIEDPKKLAFFYKDVVHTAMDDLRTPVDELEMMVDKKVWPVPTYGDLIFEV